MTDSLHSTDGPSVLSRDSSVHTDDLSVRMNESSVQISRQKVSQFVKNHITDYLKSIGIYSGT